MRILLIAIAVLTGCKLSNDSPPPAPSVNRYVPPAPPAPPPRAEPPLEVTAAKLFAAYDSNEVAADEIYKDKILLVSGSVKSIDKDFMDGIVLQLKTSGRWNTVRAHIAASEKSKAATLAKGQNTTLLCRGAGMIVKSPKLDDCRIE